MMLTTSTLLLHGFLALVTLFFGVMALYPLFLSAEDEEEPTPSPTEDVVLSIATAPLTSATHDAATITSLPVDDVDRRPAA